MTTRRHSPASARCALGRMGRAAGRIRRSPGLHLQARPTWVRLLTSVVGLGYLAAASPRSPSSTCRRVPRLAPGRPGLRPQPPVAQPRGRDRTLAGRSGLGRRGRPSDGVVGALRCSPIHERIEVEVAEVGTPAGWTVVEDGAWTGNTWGLWSDWPEVTYTYATGDSAQVAADDYAALLEAEGWERDTTGYRVDPSPGTSAQAWEKGRWNISVRVAGPGSGAPPVRHARASFR